ncbi:MAG: cell division protein FtsL [Gammaproteobacteria bacterium]|jgi:cell division protein FtsL|nr:cell division protein FtsL [Gammaproteobacteria bacterium]
MKGQTLAVVVLAVLVMVSALGVVYVKYESRKLFIQLQALQSRRDQMNVEWGRLQLEQSTWATHSRIERVARDRLGMVTPSPDSVVIVRP